MKKRMIPLLLTILFLTGCAPLLEREYSTSEPHSSKFWESDAAGTLRAENYQDIVNDLLLLIGQHTETATIRLYEFKGDVAATTAMEQATVEVQKETPLGAYGVEYITFTGEAQRGYYEIQTEIGYRRTEEQIRSVINATSPEAVYSLLDATIRSGKKELVVRIGYWDEDGRARVNETVGRLKQELGIGEEAIWLVNYYPEEGQVGLVEVLLEPTDEELAAAEERYPQEQNEAESETAEGDPLDSEGDTASSEEKEENLE